MTQDEKINQLEKKGWHFASWISTHDPENPDGRCAILTKHPRQGATNYIEVNPDGTTNY